MAEVFLDIKDLKKYFPVKNFFGAKRGEVRAVDGISFVIQKGETFGLVGESGCGKSTFGRCILHMLTPTAGEIIYKGKDLNAMSASERDEYRKNFQIIFQDPYAALNPSWNVKQIIEEPLIATGVGEHDRDARIAEIIETLNMNPDDLEKYPFEFSGGQRQRIGIARAIATNPEFIFCDEPVSALDVSIQAQVINKLKDLQEQFELTYLFTAHDLPVVYHISDRIGVMYLGRLVELGSSEEVFRHPAHPYTQALISSIPVADPKMNRTMERHIIKGELPSPFNVPKGCPFHSRCPKATERCKKEMPAMVEAASGHFCACHNL